MAASAAPGRGKPGVRPLWFSRCPVPSAFALAWRGGALEPGTGVPEGWRLQALQAVADRDVHQAHYDHRWPDLLRHGGNIPAIVARARGARTRVVALSYLWQAQKVLVLPSSPLHAPADLRGRRLHLTRRPAEFADHRYLSLRAIYEAALAEAGLSAHDVQWVIADRDDSYVDARARQRTHREGHDPVPQPTPGDGALALQALLRDEVDAVACAGPTALEWQAQLGLRCVFDAGADDTPAANNSQPLVFAISESLLRDQAALVEQVLLASLRAHADAASSRWGLARARRWVAAELAQPEHLVVEAFGQRFVDSLALGFNPAHVEALRRQVAYLHRQGAIAEPFDVDDWLDPGPLARAGQRLQTTLS